MWDWFLSLIGWTYLTPQGIWFGVACFLALAILAPSRVPAEGIMNGIFSAITAVLLAQAISLGAH